eukprot:10978017-Prorocentrum_lima.AAC.1
MPECKTEEHLETCWMARHSSISRWRSLTSLSVQQNLTEGKRSLISRKEYGRSTTDFILENGTPLNAA